MNNVGRMMLLVGGWGVATLFALVLGLETVGGVMALVHLGGLVGAPLALVLDRQLRSMPVVVALSIALSIALSALAVQSLIWFNAATDVLLVITVTLYGCVLASLLGESAERRSEAR